MGSKRIWKYKRSSAGLIMKTFFLNLVLLFALLFNGCMLFQTTPEVVIQPAFDRTEVAVLDFAAKGENISQRHGVYTADKLTESLFLTRKFSVIDRIQVRDAEKFLGITSATPVSTDQLQKIGLRLKARYLILGNLYNFNEDENFSLDNNRYLQLSFRIISVATGEVLGMATHKVDSGSGNSEQAIDKAINEIILKIPGIKD